MREDDGLSEASLADAMLTRSAAIHGIRGRAVATLEGEGERLLNDRLWIRLEVPRDLASENLDFNTVPVHSSPLELSVPYVLLYQRHGCVVFLLQNLAVSFISERCLQWLLW